MRVVVRRAELRGEIDGNDVATQATQVEQLINQGVDAIVIVPVQADSLSPQLQAAEAAGVPVIAVKDGDFIGSSLQHGRVEMAAGLAVAQMVAKGQVVKKSYTYVMPPITPENVDTYMANVVTNKDAFLKGLPKIIAANLKSGNIANEK